MRSFFTKSALAGLVLAVAAVPALAQPLTVAPGNDGWKTATGTQIDLTAYPIATVFSPTATVTPTLVTLAGSPLDAANLGSYDTLLERYPPSVTFNFIGDVQTMPLEIQALRLKGVVTVTDGGIATNYNLVVALSEAHLGSVGTIKMTLATPDGGRFDSSFPVVPKLVFTEVGNPAHQVVLDCGYVAGCPADNRLLASNVCWVVKGGPGGFDPATKGITPIRAGIAVDGTYNGIADYTTVGNPRAGFAGKAFYAGWQPVPPFNPCTTGVQEIHAAFAQNASKHIGTPALDCPPTGTTGTAGTKATGSPQPVPSYCLQQADPTPVGTADGTAKNKKQTGRP